MDSTSLDSFRKLFVYYKDLSEKAIQDLTDEELHHKFASDANSIAIIMKHLAGNMVSRWTDFLTSDGEKSWRNRDQEFVDDFNSREALIAYWESGWTCLFNAIKPLKEKDLGKFVTIRSEKHTVAEALNRQLAHYAYHVGQIVFIAKCHRGKLWKSLSIPKGASDAFNRQMQKPK
jgi:uncharacterized damage-inducible protein DinB